jgi:hypothetical protein
MLAEGFDLLVPTREVGVLAFLLRNGATPIEPGVRANERFPKDVQLLNEGR